MKKPISARQAQYDADMAAMRRRNERMAAQSPAARQRAREAAAMVPGVKQTSGAFDGVNALRGMVRRPAPKKR